jgi:adenylate cyclase
MATGDVKRKLTAIFSADVEGYSRLMEEDELATIETLTSHKEVMGKLIRQYRGRVVDSTGDNLLAEFGSVVDAVQCAVEVQQVLSAKNETLPQNRRMSFRIGINLGDVVEEGERIYGNGVNVAARVESLAEGGGISISGTAYDQLGKKLPLGYEYLGEQTVKNIEKPVRVYRILTEAEAAGKVIGEVKPKTKQLRGVAIGAVAVLIIVAVALAIWNFYFRPAFEPASVEKMAFPLPDEPSIAVLPFTNMSGDPQQEYFSDGITEQIITTLSKVPKMFVIARNSTFVYKGKPVKVSQVGEELGVRYVLEGSVQKSGDRVRITAQLIDTTKGHHLWADAYDRNLSDIFALQDEIAKKVITALQVKLTEGEQARLWARGTDNREAWLKFLQGFKHYRQRNPDDLILARQFFEEAIDLDPEYADPFIYMGQIHLTEVRQGLSKSPQKSIDQAFELAQKALSLDELHPGVHTLLAWVYLDKGQYEKGIEACERAVALYPNHNHSLFFLGIALSVSDRPHEAIPYFERALRLNPLDPTPALYGLGDTYRVIGRYEEAIPKLEKALALKPKYFPALLNLAACYSSVGREQEAHAIVEQLLKLNPNFSLERFAKTMLHRGAVKERYLAALRKAGLPETPPLPLPDKPSIAVLPFVNMSDDPKQELFSDGLSQNIITQLTKIPEMVVIAQTSSFKYKGKSVTVQQVGRELGVRYVLEGSVLKAGNQLRVTAQLIDANTGAHLWAQAYDRQLEDFFQVQDEITLKVVNALQVKLTEGTKDHVFKARTKSLKAHTTFIESYKLWEKFNREDNERAKKVMVKAIALDPDYSVSHSGMAWIHLMEYFYGWSKDPKRSLQMVEEFAKKAIALDDTEPTAHAALAQFYSQKGQFDLAIKEMERALELAPSDAGMVSQYGESRYWIGEYEEGLKMMKKAMVLRPFPPPFYLARLGMGYYLTEQYEQAATVLTSSSKKYPRQNRIRLWLIPTLVALGREKEARDEAEKLLEIDPKFSAKKWANRYFAPYKDPKVKKRILEQYAKAGLS